MSSKNLNVLFFPPRMAAYDHPIFIRSLIEAISNELPQHTVSYLADDSERSGSKLPVNARAVQDIVKDESSFLNQVMSVLDIIESCPCSIVVAHEYFPAIVAARVLKKRAVFIGAWLPRAGSQQAEAICLANQVIVLEEAGLFPFGMELPVRAKFIGQVSGPTDGAAPNEIDGPLGSGGGLSRGKHIVSIVVDRTWRSVHLEYIDLGLSAFALLPVGQYFVQIISTQPNVYLRGRFDGLKNIIYKEINCYQLWSEVRGVDLIVNFGSRGLAIEAAKYRLPAISIINGSNAAEELLLGRLPGNIVLHVRALDARILRDYICKTIVLPCRRLIEECQQDGFDAAVAEIKSAILVESGFD